MVQGFLCNQTLHQLVSAVISSVSCCSVFINLYLSRAGSLLGTDAVF